MIRECTQYPMNLVDIDEDELVLDIGANVDWVLECNGNGDSTISDLVEPSVYNCEQIRLMV